MSLRSCLYVGSLGHSRGGSVKNRFRYPLYTGCFDLDELDAIDRRLRLFGVDRRALFSIRGSDYALRAGISAPSRRPRPERDLKSRVLDYLTAAGSEPLPDTIDLITQPRVFGYVFNPVSFFLGWNGGELVSVIAEINNTYDQTYAYVLDDRCRVPDPRGPAFETDKRFYVSPFIGDDCTYRWIFPGASAGGARLQIRMVLDRPGGRFFAAELAGERRDLSDFNLLRAFARHPALPVQIITRIHTQALRLRALGLQYRRPAPAPGDV